jgi:redox-sensitive bicupin YhaK (pirin superfamily)
MRPKEVPLGCMDTLMAAAPRAVTRIIDSHLATVGEGLSVRRVLPDHGVRSVGPWVFLDHFGPQLTKASSRGVPPHPHAGIETVSYLLEGGMAHRDSAGHQGIVDAGGAQWMTSGRGIVHAEQPVSSSGEDTFMLHGVQLWTTLPRALKMMEPAYQNLSSSSIPVVEGDGVKVRVIGGDFEAVQSPAKTLMPLFAWHVTVQPGKEFVTPVPELFEAGAYVLAGEGTSGSDRTQIRIGQLAIFAQGDRIGVNNTSDAPLDLLLLGGAPAEGPLVFHGPFVMNSVEQIRYAERAYMTGRMGSLAQD